MYIYIYIYIYILFLQIYDHIIIIILWDTRNLLIYLDRRPDEFHKRTLSGSALYSRRPQVVRKVLQKSVRTVFRYVIGRVIGKCMNNLWYVYI